MRTGRALLRSSGFTLIEIAIVVAIIGLLLLISLPLFSGARNRAYIAEGRQISSEWKSLQWGCFVEKNFKYDPCNTLSEIGWSSRPTSDVWNTGTVADPTFDAANDTWTTVTLTLNSLTTGPLGTGKAIQVTLAKSSGKVTEVLSGL